MRHTETSGRPLPRLAAWALIALAGCVDPDAGPSVRTYPVKGRVVMADGKPLADGSVVFVPSGTEGTQAAGKIGPDGSFALTTRKEGDGAAAGTYKVRVDGASALSAAKGSKAKSAGLGVFADEDSSGLTATITAGGNDLEPFVLRPPDAAAKAKGEASKGRAD